MSSLERQKEDRQVRRRHRIAAPLIGFSFVALTWSVPLGLPYSTSVWHIVRILLCSPGVWLSSFAGWHQQPAVSLIASLNFVFYAGASYLLMRWWSFRDDELLEHPFDQSQVERRERA